MTELARADIVIGGDDSPLNRTLNAASAKLNNVGASLQRAGFKLSAAITLPVAAAGTAATALATTFDTEMTKIETLVGVNREQVDAWRQDLLALGPAVAKGPGELARAMFVVTSAGERGANALQIVNNAAKASAAGLGDTATIARSVTAAMQAYKDEGLDAATATDVLVSTVREGNLEASSLAQSLGTVIGIASQVGVTFSDVGSFIATFTRLGVDARIASTSLRATLNTLIRPSNEAKEALASVGLSVGELRNQIEREGLARTFVELIQTFEGNEEAIGKVIPNVRALAGVLGTAGAQGEEFIRISDSIADSQGTLDEAFARTAESAGFQFRQALAQLQTTGIQIGSMILPQIADAATRVTNVLNNLNPRAVRLGMIWAGVASAIGPALIVLGTLIKSIGSIIGLITTLGSAVSTAIGFFGALVGALNPVTIILAGIAAAVVSLTGSWRDMGEMAALAWGIVVEVAPKALRTVGTIAEGLFNSLIGTFNLLGRIAIIVWEEFVRDPAVAAFQTIKSWAEPIFSAIASALENLGRLAKGAAEEIRGFFAEAGEGGDEEGATIGQRFANAVVEAYGTNYVAGIVDWTRQGVDAAIGIVQSGIARLNQVGQEGIASEGGAVAVTDMLAVGAQNVKNQFMGLHEELTNSQDVWGAYQSAYEKAADPIPLVRMEEAAGSLSSSIGNAFASLVTGAQGFAEAVSSAAQRILADIARMIAQALVLRAILKFIPGGEAIVGALGGFSKATGRQHGGPISPGRSYLVGEAGPELITPSTAGEVTSTRDMGRGGGVSAQEAIDALGPLPRPQTPREVSRDSWYREFIKLINRDIDERT